MEAGAAAGAAVQQGVVVKEEPVDEAAIGKRARSPSPTARVVRPRLAPKEDVEGVDVEGVDVEGVNGLAVGAEAGAGPSASGLPVDEESESSGMEEEEDDEATLDQVGAEVDVPRWMCGDPV